MCFRRSFESRLNYERPVPNYLDDPEGLTFKPRARHLAIYNNVDSKKDVPKRGTSQQDNPFIPDDDATLQVTRYDPRHSSEHPEYYDIGDTGDKRYSSLSSMPSSFAPEPNRQMRAVNEIEYQTAIAPMDEQLSYGNDSSSANGSLPSSTNSVNGAFSTFRSGSSTQHLVTPKTTPKGTINKRPAVSFIDGEDVNMYNPQVILEFYPLPYPKNQSLHLKYNFLNSRFQESCLQLLNRISTYCLETVLSLKFVFIF